MSLQRFYNMNGGGRIVTTLEIKCDAYITYPSIDVFMKEWANKMTNGKNPKCHQKEYFDRQLKKLKKQIKEECFFIPKGSHLVEVDYGGKKFYDVFGPDEELILEDVEFNTFAAFTV